MKVAFIGVALAISIDLVSAFPRLVARTDDPCYCVDHVNDDNGKKYGGSYDLCSESFDAAWPKPIYSGTDNCWTTAYEDDECGYQYGGYVVAVRFQTVIDSSIF
ncbi:hypothetical protein LTR54_018408 [Friedmanniomyces endolithicus]|nr:hypothetical protein LTR03_017804 [Friedmanniomyces endolithicus]KAK0963481.1 hypothetical protein LTR54_018408 [Friedmanniomyces endolithicus]